MLIRFRHLKKSMFTALPLAVVFGVSSARYTGSALRGAATGLLGGMLGALLHAWVASRAERKLSKEGIDLPDPPVRPKLVLKSNLSAERLIALCREGLKSPTLRVKRLETDTDRRIVAVTRVSFYSFSERVTAEVKTDANGRSILEISSVPRVSTTVSDGGANYRNVYLLGKFVKQQAGEHSFSEESLLDLDKMTPVKG